ncbi:FtsX-like permease family protein [Microbacterium sp. cf046]|uniref:FtsX-like permease family protein n=1 Tax=Microbacterium sp. cf046 TaxID=1761803 RepID=UPI0008E11026|nr:FtsX-like permease family protein [Microbacterium sp. cf046]SFS13264.1 FtsX-like permease family protein [Microbacterium sp. cf046]
MAHARALSTARLLRARASARRGLLASATATVSVAVATVVALLAWLTAEVGRAGDAAPPGVPEDEVAAQVADGVIALVSAAPALILLVVILAGTAAALLGRLLAAAREQETANVRARGLSRRQATVANAVESAAASSVGAIGGLALAAIVLAVTGAPQWPLTLVSLWWVAAVTALVLAIVLVVAARPRAETRPRGARATTAAGVVIVLLAAAFVLWQLRLARPTGFDPIAALAPTVVLLAGALVVLAVFGAASAAWAIGAAARPPFVPAYPARQVARRLPVYAVAVLLVGLTVAQAVFASAYSSTWTAMATDSAALRVGADLRVDLEPAEATPAIIADAAAIEGVDAAAPALVVPVEIGSTDAQLVSVPTAAIGTVVSSAGGIVDLDALSAAVQPADGSVASEPLALGADATGLRITASIDATRANAASSVVIVATVLDATGAAAQLRLEGPVVEQDDGTATLTGEAGLPAGTAPWRLLAVTASIPANFATASVLVGIVAAEAIGGDPLPLDGEVALDENAREQVAWLADADPEAAEPAAVRAVIGSALATRLGLEVGDAFEFRYAGTGRRGEFAVADIVPAIPGAATALAVFAPLEVLQVSMLQRGTSIVPPASLWASGDPSADAALSAALDDRPVETSSPGVTATIVGALVPGWWIATAGSAVLSLIAAFAIVQTLALARRRELGVLRALGVAPAAQARMRAAELAGVLGSSVALGALAGLLVAWLLVPELVRAVTPGILPLGTPVTFAWPGPVVAIGFLVIGLAAIVVAAAASVRRAAGDSTVGEDAR